MHCASVICGDAIPRRTPAFPEHRVHFPQRRGAFRDGALRVVRAARLCARLVQVLDELGGEPGDLGRRRQELVQRRVERAHDDG
jgi:hypothetical protein